MPKGSDGKILVCPHCLKQNLEVTGGFFGTKYRCEDCNYYGALVLEVDEDFDPEQVD